MLCFRELQAFISAYPTLHYHVSREKGCLLRAIKTSNGEASRNVAFQKCSPWKNIISEKILQYKERGLIDDTKAMWVQTSCLTQNFINPTSHKYRISHFSGLVIFIIVVLIFSMFMVLAECWISKKMKKLLIIHLNASRSKQKSKSAELLLRKVKGCRAN